MKKIKLSILFILSLLTSICTYSQGWQWAQGLGGLGTDDIRRIVTRNNIYVSGRFESPICYFATDTLYRSGSEDLFIAKFDNNGVEQWVRQLGGPLNLGPSHEYITGIEVDSITEDIYITGRFTINIAIDSVFLSGTQSEIFIAKYNRDGNLMWAISEGGSGDDWGGTLILDSLGYLYVDSQCDDSATFGNNTVPPGNVLTKYDTLGNCLWSKTIIKNGAGRNIKYGGNSIFIGGFTLPNKDTLYIDSLSLSIHGNNDLFIAKFDTGGKLIWVNKDDGDSIVYCEAFCVDALNNIYIIGSFANQVIVNSDTLHSMDNYLAKYDSSGNFQWVREFGSRNLKCSVWDITCDKQNNVYIAGDFYDTVTFNNFTLFSVSVGDGFLVRYSSTGTCIGVDQLTGSELYGVSVNDNNQPVVCGFYAYQLTTASGTISTHGADDGFIALHDVITGENEVLRNKGNELLIYANPNSGKCSITVPDEFINEKKLVLSIYDNTGKIIQQKTLEMDEDKIKLNLEKEAKGIYVVTLSNGVKNYSGKIIFE